MIYVHIPFCRTFCTYCGFYSEIVPQCRKAGGAACHVEVFDRYAEALEAEIKVREAELKRVFASDDVNTLYIGGGTPSVMPVQFFERLLSAFEALGYKAPFKEFTMEVNPEDIVEKGADYVKGLLKSGVDRISMGVQSLDDGVLKWMNRRHTAAEAVEAYKILEASGVRNISIDLIFGFPQLTDELWRDTLYKTLDISSSGTPPRHISAYQLSIEEGSMLEKMIERGKWAEAPDQVCRRQYEILCEVLCEAGYHHYEISNFAQPGYEAEHNSAYWRHVPYVGLGPGAHSYIPHTGNGTGPLRRWNEPRIEAYLEAAHTGFFSGVQGEEVLDSEQLAIERVMLGLRTSSGLQEKMLRECCADVLVDRAIESGDLMRISGGSIRIPESRFFVSDNIISSLI